MYLHLMLFTSYCNRFLLFCFIQFQATYFAIFGPKFYPRKRNSGFVYNKGFVSYVFVGFGCKASWPYCFCVLCWRHSKKQRLGKDEWEMLILEMNKHLKSYWNSCHFYCFLMFTSKMTQSACDTNMSCKVPGSEHPGIERGVVAGTLSLWLHPKKAKELQCWLLATERTYFTCLQILYKVSFVALMNPFHG